MKNLKKFNKFANYVPPAPPPKYNMDDYCGKILFCIRGGRFSNDLSCAVFTDKNMGGYGLGIRGDYFDKTDFNQAMRKDGDSLRRKLYTTDEIDLLIKDLGYENLSKPEQTKSILNALKEERDFTSSSNPNLERENGLYVELDDLKYIITEFLYK